MDATRWKQIDELVDAALELPAAEREKFVTLQSGSDSDLRIQVLELLAAQKDGDEFLNKSAMQVAARAIAEDQTEISAFAFVNKKIATYRVERLLGAGGMGEVYLAFDEKLKRKVALKILPAEFVSNDERVKRFEMEARAISSLNHPGIVTIYDVGNYEGVNYIATEFVEGKTLRDLMNKKFRLQNILANSIQICEALTAAHKEGIIHRDIKPENIMIRSDGYAKILDFGLAKLTDVGPETLFDFAATTKGVIIGTPAYMSPSQVCDEAVDHRTDLWSCGVVLYEFLAGKNPFKGANRQETFQSILSKDPQSCSSLNSEIPPELDRILSKLLEKDPGMGYQTAADLRTDLKRVKREVDSSPSWSSHSRETSVPSRTTVSLLSGFGIPALAALVLITAASFYVWNAFGARTGTDWASAQNVQLTEQSGTEFFPTLAPDGKSFVYSSDADGDFDLYLQRIGGKNPVNLTKESTATDTQPAFSPDGELIAFRSDREPKGIYVMESTGENTRRVADFGFHPSWSPDGKEIVVSTEERDLPNVRNTTPSSLWIVNLETGNRRLLIESDAMQPAWSPGGQRIAFWFMQPGSSKRDVGTVSINGGETILVSTDGTTNWNPVWSPEGDFLYFASDRGGNMNFWRVPIDETSGVVLGEPEAVTTPSKFSRHLAFSRDGKRMIYVQSNFQSNIQAVGFDAANEKTAGEPFWVTSGDKQVSRPELSPDGRQFVVRLPRRTQDDIVLIDRETGEMFDLTNDEAFDRYPRWSPDGKVICFISDRTGSHEIWTIDADGRNLSQITFGNSDGVTFPHWSPDGKRMLFRVNQQNYLIDLNKKWEEQTPVPLPPPENKAAFVVWDWSPDGRRLIGTFSGSVRGIGYFSFETNHYEKVSDLEEIPMWLPDSRRFAFVSKGKPYIADIESKKTREISLAQANEVRNVGVSRDGRLLYFTIFSKESDIWLLDSVPEK